MCQIIKVTTLNQITFCLTVNTLQLLNLKDKIILELTVYFYKLKCLFCYI